ncbi:putative serine/threonine-protein kinase [Termitomyces sp. J132]|nr:putative serine/threonine-protein kinase [Termitomyces sp. J132]
MWVPDLQVDQQTSVFLMTLTFVPQLLDSEWINEQFKNILEIALLRLAQTYQLNPRKLFLDDVLYRNALLARNNGTVRGIHNRKVVTVKISGSRLESSHMLIWTRLRHANVVPVYGMCTIARYDFLGQYDGVGLVSPFVENTNVINFLKANAAADRQSFILDVALGMSYLHENEVVHGRIHGQNILITSTDPPRACLVDFGLGAVVPVGTRAAHFLAPEFGVLGSQCPGTKAGDVYAFSTASYEILTKPEHLEKEWSPWLDPFKPDDSGLDDSTWELLLDSWQEDPDKRPRACQVVERLEEMKKLKKLRVDQLEMSLNTILKDPKHYKQLLSCPEADAQEVLDAFQLLLDTNQLEDRVQLIAAMRRLSERTGLYPRRFLLKDPLKRENNPVASGGFADIYKVNVDVLGDEVCVKAKNGNLNEYLERNPEVNRILLVLDTAAGVDYLHKNDIVHGDLKGSLKKNVFIDSSGRACLGDFGLSSVTDPQIINWTSQSIEASTGGTIRWQAPELLRDVDKIHNSKESDVFAWASICYEAFTGRLPFYEIKHLMTLMAALLNGKTPTRPRIDDPAWSEHGLNDRIWDLMEDCWKSGPLERPKMVDIISVLKQENQVDSRPSGDWEGRVSMRYRIAQGHNPNLTKELSSLWDRLGVLLSRIVPRALERD